MGRAALRLSSGARMVGRADGGRRARHLPRRVTPGDVAPAAIRGPISPLLIPWGLGQQFALHTVFLREAQATLSRPAGIWLAALMFAALHLPNPFLTLMTGLGALAWCWIYDRHPNLLPLALSHALLTLAILYAFDDAITGRLRVGAGLSRLLNNADCESFGVQRLRFVTTSSRTSSVRGPVRRFEVRRSNADVRDENDSKTKIGGRGLRG